MNYQNENKFITCVEDETRREELGFTGIVTDMYKDKKISNRIHLEISNRHVSRYLYDKPVFTFWIETDKSIEEVYNTILFRIIEFNFKNNEQYNDIRDKEIIITKVYGKQELTNEVRETWSIYDNVKAQMDKLIKENNGCTEAVNVINLDEIPGEYKITEITYKPDKNSIKAAIKLGKEIPGAEIQIYKSINRK